MRSKYVFFILIAITLFNTGFVLAQEPDSEQQQLELAYNRSLKAVQKDAEQNEKRTLSNDFYTVMNEWLGTPYRYSGDSKSGIDCSGFVAMIYKKVFNIELSDCSSAIYKNDVTPKQRKDLQPGDLVFFTIRKKRISHVGVYLGDNKFVHATVKSGVIISDLDEPYYRKYFYKGGSVNI